MKESQFGFQYSWADLQPVRALTVVVSVGQALGGVAGLLWPRYSDWFDNLWCGAAQATFPAFLVGLVLQAYVKPGSLGENKVMVRRVGLVTAFLTAIGIAMPTLGR